MIARRNAPSSHFQSNPAAKKVYRRNHLQSSYSVVILLASTLRGWQDQISSAERPWACSPRRASPFAGGLSATTAAGPSSGGKKLESKERDPMTATNEVVATVSAFLTVGSSPGHKPTLPSTPSVAESFTASGAEWSAARVTSEASSQPAGSRLPRRSPGGWPMLLRHAPVLITCCSA